MLGSHRTTAKKESLAPSSRSSASETAKIQEEKRKSPQETGQAGAETSSPYPSFGRSASPHSIHSSSASSLIPPKVIFQSPALGEASKRTDDFYARAFHKLGTRAHEAGQTDRAVKHFQDALRSDPTPDFRDKVQNDLDVLLSQCPPPSPPPPSPPSDTAVPSTADPPIPTLNEGRYEGDFRDGKKHGRGIHTWPNADRFEGEWRNGKMTGRGIYNFASGAR